MATLEESVLAWTYSTQRMEWTAGKSHENYTVFVLADGSGEFMVTFGPMDQTIGKTGSLPDAKKIAEDHKKARDEQIQLDRPGSFLIIHKQSCFKARTMREANAAMAKFVAPENYEIVELKLPPKP